MTFLAGMTVLALSGSFRTGSFNTALAAAALTAAGDHGAATAEGPRLDTLPFFDAGLEAAGDPPAVAALRHAIATAEALVIATPQYNGSVPGVLANALEWLSRPAGRSVLRGKPIVVLSASPGPSGAARAADHLASMLRHMGADVVATVSVPRAATRLAGGAADRALAAELSAAVSPLVRLDAARVA